MFRITTRDVGATQAATIWFGEAEVIEFYTGTRHEIRSIENAERAFAVILGDFLAEHLPVYRGDFNETVKYQ